MPNITRRSIRSPLWFRQKGQVGGGWPHGRWMGGGLRLGGQRGVLLLASMPSRWATAELGSQLVTVTQRFCFPSRHHSCHRNAVILVKWEIIYLPFSCQTISLRSMFSVFNVQCAPISIGGKHYLAVSIFPLTSLLFARQRVAKAVKRQKFHGNEGILRSKQFLPGKSCLRWCHLVHIEHRW